MKCLVLLIVVHLFFASAAFSQIPVIDVGNLTQTALIAERTLNEFNTLVAQYQTIVRMAQSLGSLDRYRIPPIGITAHDVSRWSYGAPWLQGLNSGDADGRRYTGVTRTLEPPGTLLADLPAPARQAIERA